MGVGDTTPQQRLERLEGLLTGASRDPRAARFSATSRKGNVLIGAALHAADRLRRGHTATDLEQKLLATMRAAMTDQEIKNWGQVYRQSVDRLGSLATIPAVITSRSVTSGYSFANLRADFSPVAQEHAARPNLSVMDPETLAAGGTVDTTAFTAATRQLGFGASQARTPEQADPLPGPSQPTYRVKLELENFYVQRAVGDGFTGGRDEIYWGVTATSDKHQQPVYLSEEFGAVKQGQTRSFSSSKKVVFDGAASNGVVLHIMCWEADQSTSEWYDKLQLAMRELNDKLFNTWQWQISSGIADAGLIGGLVLEMIQWGAYLITIWRNDDDLSCERGFALDQHALAVMAHRGTTEWHFDGDGYHKLKVKYTGEKVPFPEGTLEYAVRTGDSWGAPIALPWKSLTPPALASYKGMLYAAYVRPGDNGVMWTRLENGVWRKPQRIGDDDSYFAVALGAGGKLYYCVTGRNQKLHVRTFDDGTSSWGPVTRWDYTGLAMAPTIGGYPGKLYMTHVGLNGTIWHHIQHGQGWESHWADNLGWATNNPVPVIIGGAKTWRIMRGKDGRVHTSTSAGERSWANQGVANPDWLTTHGPALAYHGNKLWIFLRNSEGFLRAATHDGAWSATHQVSGTRTIKLMDEPAAASHDGKLYVMYRR